MKYIVVLFLSFNCLISFACLNEEHVTKSGKSTVDAFTLKDLRFFKNHNRAQLELAIKNLLSEKPVTEEDILSTQNSIAVTYIKLGKLAEAEAILNELLKKHPENYSLTINLGTLYELQGKNAKALQYIKKAIAINPASHSGSEWFHIKILEYKLKNIPDSKITNQNILDLYKMKMPATDIAYDITYQLQERIPFTAAPNLLIAKVMQELGDFLADSISIKAAYVMYETGMDYDKENVLQLAAKRDALRPFFKKYKEKIPYTGSYYLDAAMQIAADNKIEMATTILEKGFNYLKEQEEKRKQEKQQQYILWGGGMAAGVLLVGLFFYRRRKKGTV
jgi:tetratricopeptide (TPR) repeat protein